MYEKIKTFACREKHIKAVVLNGSRANPAAPEDNHRDYDLTFYVSDIKPFQDTLEWIGYFGKPLIKQVNPHPAEKRVLGAFTEGYIVMVIYTDGSRLDMSFEPLTSLDLATMDSLSVVLYDETGLLADLPRPSDKDYRIGKPNADDFALVVNNFLWCSLNVVKGIKRGEVPYVKGMLDEQVRKMFLKMAAWQVAENHDWTINTGSYHKWLRRYMDTRTYQAYLSTYVGADLEANKQALIRLYHLFDAIASKLASKLDFTYNQAESDAVLSHMQALLT